MGDLNYKNEKEKAECVIFSLKINWDNTSD